MSLEKAEPASLNSFRNVKRRAVSLTSESLVKMSHLTADSTFPLVIEPVLDQMNLVTWANSEREKLETLLLKHGAILFRNFRIASVDQFEQFARAISPDLLDYLERAAPRTEVGKNVYTSTEYPADQRIPLHHEMSYSHNWPTKIWFHCVQAAAQGGATPIAEDRKVFQRLDPKIKEIFMRKKVMYTRNYGEGVDLSWQDVFQTEDRSRVEEYCRQAKTEFEWKDHNRLKTRQIRQAVAVHPKTGEMVWFNHAHMFHISNVEPAVREALLSEFKEEDLPRNAYYGDGTKIEDSILEEIRGVYDELAVTFRWQEGDIMMLDNFLASHGRESYVGPRRVVVAMAELYTNKEI